MIYKGKKLENSQNSSASDNANSQNTKVLFVPILSKVCLKCQIFDWSPICAKTVSWVKKIELFTFLQKDGLQSKTWYIFETNLL